MGKMRYNRWWIFLKAAVFCGCFSSRVRAEEGRMAQEAGGGAEKLHPPCVHRHGGVFLAHLCVDSSGPIFCFLGHIAAFGKGEMLELSMMPCFQGQCEDSQHAPGRTEVLVTLILSC